MFFNILQSFGHNLNQASIKNNSFTKVISFYVLMDKKNNQKTSLTKAVKFYVATDKM